MYLTLHVVQRTFISAIHHNRVAGQHDGDNLEETTMEQAHTIPTAQKTRGRPRKAVPVAAPTQFPGKVIRLKSRPRLAVGDLVEICGKALPGNIGKRAVIREFEDGGWIKIESVIYMLDGRNLETGEVTRNSSRFGRLTQENLYRLDNARLTGVMRRIK